MKISVSLVSWLRVCTLQPLPRTKLYVLVELAKARLPAKLAKLEQATQN
jgi:hypothetical protein